MSISRLLFLCIGSIPATCAFGESRVSGELSSVEGLRILRLWGSPRERGFAHGNLLAEDIVWMFDAMASDTNKDGGAAMFQPPVSDLALAVMEFPPHYVAELEGIIAGVAAALGEGRLFIRSLDRRLNVDDLKVLNAISDLNAVHCSSFSVWGSLEANGEILTARNLDYKMLPGLRERHVVFVYLEPGEDRKQWVSVSWPALIGAYTAMNEDGVTVSMHDVHLPMPEAPGPYAPRSLVLREVMEQAAGTSGVDDALQVFRQARVLCGNNFHVSVPYHGQARPAVIAEYDGDTSRDGGVTVREADNSPVAEVSQALWCTNHYRKRGSPEECKRYATMTGQLQRMGKEGKHIDVKLARGILRDVSKETTLQSVVFLPNRGELYVALANATQSASAARSVRLDLKKLLKKSALER